MRRYSCAFSMAAYANSRRSRRVTPASPSHRLLEELVVEVRVVLVTLTSVHLFQQHVAERLSHRQPILAAHRHDLLPGGRVHAGFLDLDLRDRLHKGLVLSVLDRLDALQLRRTRQFSRLGTAQVLVLRQLLDRPGAGVGSALVEFVAAPPHDAVAVLGDALGQVARVVRPFERADEGDGERQALDALLDLAQVLARGDRLSRLSDLDLSLDLALALLAVSVDRAREE